MTNEELDRKIDKILESCSIRQSETPKQKGKKQMSKMNKQAYALMKWRQEHTDKNGKVVIARRSPEKIVAELQKKREFYTERLAMIDKKIRYYDTRMNADKRKKLLSMVSTEQLEELVKSMGK